MICIDVMPEFKPGDAPPEGYLAWHEWAEVQYSAGLEQVECGSCGKWKYPQELSGIIEVKGKSRRGDEVTVTEAQCSLCHLKRP